MNIVLPYYPFQYQMDVHNSTKRFQIIIGGRRVGKSIVAFHEMIRHCLSNPNHTVWWISPTYRDAQETGFEFLADIYDALKPAIHSIHYSNMIVTFTNGTKLYFKGSDKYNTLRGRGLNLVVLDEAAFAHVDVWKKALRPALSDKKGRAILTTTPNGRNWLYEQYTYASSLASYGYWDTYHWPSSLSPLLDDDDLADAKRELSGVDYKQEYLAEFVTPAGMVYEDFDDSNIIDHSGIDKDKHSFYLGIDFGFAAPTAIVFMAVDPILQRVIQFDEIYRARQSIENLITQITQKLNDYGLTPAEVTVYTDPAGNAEELSSGLSPVDCMRRAGYNIVNRGSNIAPGISLVRSFILNAEGKRRFTINSKCVNSIKSLYGYSYKTGYMGRPTDEAEKDGVHDHACDAIRYFFVNKFDHAKYVASSLKQTKYLASPGKTGIMKRCGACHRPFLSKTPKDEPPFVCTGCN